MDGDLFVLDAHSAMKSGTSGSVDDESVGYEQIEHEGSLFYVVNVFPLIIHRTDSAKRNKGRQIAPLVEIVLRVCSSGLVRYLHQSTGDCVEPGRQIILR